MTDLNTAIALQRGYVENFGLMDKASLHPHKYWICPDGQLTSGLPDYEHDANLYMALFEEMEDMCFIQKINNRFYSVGKTKWENVEIFSRNNTIGTAICIAYCKLKGIEVVG